MIIKIKLKDKNVSKSENFRCFVLIFSEELFSNPSLESFDDQLMIFHFRWTNYLLLLLSFQIWVI